MAGRSDRPSMPGELQTRVVEERRGDVDPPGDRVDHAPFGDADPGHDPGHPQRRVIDEDAVGVLAVLPEALAVVRGHEHERGERRSSLADAMEQARDL